MQRNLGVWAERKVPKHKNCTKRVSPQESEAFASCMKSRQRCTHLFHPFISFALHDNNGLPETEGLRSGVPLQGQSIRNGDFWAQRDG